MRIFEFHFNPKLSQDLVFDSFCYEPKNSYEKRLGSLLIIGEIKNALPQNSKLLNDFSDFFKKNYYASSDRSKPEASLKECLKKANNYLEEVAKKGDVSWLGNFGLAALSLKSKNNKWWEANFTKTGQVKIILLRSGQIIDLGKNLELEEIEPYPLKIFNKIVSGKLAKGDALLMMTKEVFDFFSQKPGLSPSLKKAGQKSQSLIEKIAGQEIEESPNIEARLKEILKPRKDKLVKLQGSLLLVFLEKNILPKKKQSFAREKDLKSFSLSQVFEPIIQKVKKARKKARLRLLKTSKTKTPKARPKRKNKSHSGIKAFLKHKNVVLILALILLLALGVLIFRG